MTNNQTMLTLFRRGFFRLKTKGPVWTAQRAVSFVKSRIDAINKVKTGNADFGYLKFYELQPAELMENLKNLEGKKIKVGSVQVENTRFCNLRCPGCLLTNETEAGNWSAEHMSHEDFKVVCDNLPAARSMRLFNFGEPSMNPHFMDMVRYAKQTGKFDRIISTSNLLTHTPEYFDELFEVGLDFLSISVDTLDQEIADKLRTRTKVDKLKKHLEYLIIKRTGNINISTVISRINIGDLENLFGILDGMAEKSGETLQLSPMAFSDYFISDQKEKIVGTKEINDVLMHLQRLFLNLNIALINDSDEKPTSICDHPWKNLIVNVKGEVVACNNHQEVAVQSEACGLLTYKSYEEIISSPSMIQFFNSYLHKSPDFCANCFHDFKR